VFLEMNKIFLSIILILATFYNGGCFFLLLDDAVETDTEDKIGTVTGSPSSASGYDSSGRVDVTVKIQPYTKGFKVTFTPSSRKFICSALNYVIQSGSQYSFDVASTISIYENGYFSYDGYVESGADSNCGYYSVATTWVVFSDDVGFNPLKNYSVQLDDVKDTSRSVITINVSP
jgi:hypothetical protein